MSENNSKTRQLVQVALGEAEADLAVINGKVVNVYTHELQEADILVKGDRIAYVGKNTAKGIGPSTTVIDAAGKIVIPGLIDGHTHIASIFNTSELLRFAMKGGTTTIITETEAACFTMGYKGITAFLDTIKDQPVKVFIVAPPMVSISPSARENSVTLDQIRRLLKRKEVVGLGESFWQIVNDGDEKALDFINETIRRGKVVDGHTAGAKDNKLQAFVATGVSSCHEPTNAAEVRERLRLGLYVMVREGHIRKDLLEVSKIKDENIDFRRMALSTDGVDPGQLLRDGYMEYVVQKAIDYGFNPITAIQMATLNIAERFGLDGGIGGIAPGKYADMVIIPDLQTIRAEYVISNGQIIAQNGALLVQPRKHPYPKSFYHTIRLPKKFTANDFIIRAEGKQRKVRVIDQVTGLLTKEAIVEMPVVDGQLRINISKDILKAAAIEQTNPPFTTYTGFIRGYKMKHGAIASSAAWDISNITVVGADESDMALAVNRITELGGGIIVVAGGKIIGELPLPVGGLISEEPMEVIAAQLKSVQQAAESLGVTLQDIRLTVSVLTTPAIPFLRICKQGLFDLKTNRYVDLILP